MAGQMGKAEWVTWAARRGEGPEPGTQLAAATGAGQAGLERFNSSSPTGPVVLPVAGPAAAPRSAVTPPVTGQQTAERQSGISAQQTQQQPPRNNSSVPTERFNPAKVPMPVVPPRPPTTAPASVTPPTTAAPDQRTAPGPTGAGLPPTTRRDLPITPSPASVPTPPDQEGRSNACGPSIWNRWLPEGVAAWAPWLVNNLPTGVGVTLGAAAEAGDGLSLGAAGTVSAGGGVFQSGRMGLSAGALLSYGATGYAGSDYGGVPQQEGRPLVFGASYGANVSLFATNAQSVQQLRGPFTTLSASVGYGPGVSASLSYGGGIYQLSVSPPGFARGRGYSVSRITTNTRTTDGCE